MARALRSHPLPAILCLALALRAWSAGQPVFAHPDEIYQYLEPAHRLLTGVGVVTWEWRVGMRSWLLPALLAPFMALGRWVAPDGILALLLPRLAVATASLSIVWTAWAFGARTSRQAAVIAALVAACWFELVYYGARTLSEPLATAAALPAAVLLTASAARRGGMVLAGALLAFAVLLRPHYAPACLLLLLVASGRALPTRLVPLSCGAAAMLAVAAAVDGANGLTPFRWIAENLAQNVGAGRAERYGTAPPFAYLAWYEALWRWWAIPLLIAARFGYRRAPALFWTALATLAVHSLIGHKEYRFVFLPTASLVVLAGLGTAALVEAAQRRWPGLPRTAAGIAALLAWGAASLALAEAPQMRRQWTEGRAGSILAATLRADRASCGVALVEPVTFADLPGLAGLRAGTRMDVFMVNDPALDGTGRRGALHAHAGAYNRILAPRAIAGAMPRGFAPQQCTPSRDGPICIFARRGGCGSDTRSPFAVNHALRRMGL